jgi:hypothetical protein
MGACADPVQVTTNAAPPGTAVNVFLLACVAGLLATVSGRLSRRVPQKTGESGASTLLWELGQHIVQLGAVLSTTIVRCAPVVPLVRCSLICRFLHSWATTPARCYSRSTRS